MNLLSLRRSFVIFCAAATLMLGTSPNADAQKNQLRGSVRIDGSSTVFPISEAASSFFAKYYPDVKITLGQSGTGGGFKRFVKGETDISDASRPIKPSEYKATVDNKVEFIEMPIAYDGLTIVVPPESTFVDKLTVDELKKIFLADSAAKTWSEVRAGWPAQPIKIFAPGTDSGTFDYFKEVVAGKKGNLRSDMETSEDDNVLVRGVAGTASSIGFFGYAYYKQNADKLLAVPIVNPDSSEAVTPSMKTIENGTYAPFSRPLFLYVNKRSLRRPEVITFVKTYIVNSPKLAGKVGYVPLPSAIYKKVAENIKGGVTGTYYITKEGGSRSDQALVDVFVDANRLNQ